MGGEKHGSKGGGYVGGFLQLFDWNAKARKKLSWTKSDLSEPSKQKKRSDGNLPMTRFNLMNEDELVAGSSIKGSSDYSCASSVTDDEGYGNRAPGVVARLMGLDSMPQSSNVSEPFSTPFFDSQSLDSHSLRDAPYHRRNLNFYQECQPLHSGNLHNKVDIPNQKAMEPKPQKMVNRPIEKFQTEILPPKSAKSIPITHHKLLSPIKSPGFIPYRNAAHIMEAAAKIIEQGPQASTNAKMPSLGTSSIPLKVKDLKERVESAQKPLRLAEASGSIRPVESNAAKFLKGQSMNKSLNGSTHVMSDSGDSSGTKTTGKSVSLALQAKVNVQRREGLNQSDSRSLFGQKEQSEVTSGQTFFKSQPNSQKRTQKKSSAHSSSTVLRQNNQKQNSANDKEKVPSKSLLSNSQGKKVLSGDSRHKSSGKFGGTSKNGLRKSVPEATESEKEVSNSSQKNVPRKKRSIDGNFHPNNTEKSLRSSAVEDRQFTWTEDRKRKGSDVVSFTFTAPLTRSVPAREFSAQVAEENYGFRGDGRGKTVIFNSDSPNNRNLSSLGCNVLGADALSILLERKLKELTHGVESPSYRAGVAGDSISFDQDLVPNSKAVFTTPMSHNGKRLDAMLMDKVGGDYGSIFSSTDSMGLMVKLKLQAMDKMDECGSNDTEARKLFQYRHPSPISVLEPYFPSESCNSSDSADSNSTQGSKQCSSVLAQEAIPVSYSKKFHSVDSDAELLDSASTTFARMNKTHFVGSTNTWELVYVKEILFNVELMFKDFALGQAREIINPRLFDQLEGRKEVSEGEEQKLRRKVLFDCVSECTDLRCRRFAGGGSRTWAKGLSILRTKDRLAKEVYKEISGWGGMGDFMVDDLVDKDMSSCYGKWLDYEVESFELGIEIEGRILDSLVNEVIADILVL
ncbi:hypothetical protein RHGRI_012677 [Rhododendron griersonianum]|uniref:DUF4378 domain-containing protein n=1 Tax=Rhododendron griersonianum TaxID=479676 RepID=A0AAV6KS17_9ERIC|nr:hypothetical protein RHGRI_012677 [Rhododendron griersonianum]